MAQVAPCRSADSLGRSGFQSDRRPAAAAGAARRGAAAVVRGRAARLRLGRDRAGDRRRGGAVSDPTRPRRRTRPPAVVLPGVCICRGAARRRRWLARTSAQSGAGCRRRADRHRGGRAGQRAAARAGVQRPAAGGARQPRPRDDAAGRRRAARAGRRNRSSSSGRRTPRTSTRWPTRTPAEQISTRPRRPINAPILVGGVRRRARTTRREQPGSRPTRSSCGTRRPDPANATTSRSCSRSASTCRGAASSATCPSYADRAGYFVPGHRHRRGARRRRADRGDDLLGGHLRPRARASRCATAPRC